MYMYIEHTLLLHQHQHRKPAMRRKCSCRRATILIAYRCHIYNNSLWKLISFPRPIRKVLLFQRRAPQWNIYHKNMNMQTWIFDQTANEKNIKMVRCKFIQSRRTEMASDTGSWITMATCALHALHTVYSWLHGWTLHVYKRVCANYNVHCTCVWNSLSKVFVNNSCLWDREYNVISLYFNLIS